MKDFSPLLHLVEKGIPVKWSKYEHNCINVADNPWETPPPEIIKQGNQAILDYFRAREEQGTSRLYEAKLLILGEGGAGKTSLCCKLKDPAANLPEEEDTTRGIDIHVLHFKMKNGEQFRMNVWDFGGQEVYHATHQFFLNKRSLYLLLDDTRKDDKSANDPAFRYWLEATALLGGGSPLLIVQNEKGDRSKSLDLRSMKGRFDFVQGSLATNLLTGRGLDKLRAEIEHLIQNLPHVGTPLPKQWVVIREEVEKHTAEQAYLSEEDWLSLCAAHRVDEQQALQLSQYLHDLGVFLHFQDDALLRQTIILQKEWATNACYRVLDDEQVKQQQRGRFGEEDLRRIWQDEQWRRRIPQLLALMLKFELCYELPDSQPRQWLVPQLLPASQPDDHHWEEHGNLSLRYRYDFLPKGLLSRIIVRLHRFVSRPDLAWRSGVLLERLGAKAEVMELAGERDVIRIRLAPLRGSGGDKDLRKELLVVVAEEFDKLHATFSNLKVEKLIPCNCEKCQKEAEPFFYEYNNLLRRRQARKQVNCDKSLEDVDVPALLDGVGAQPAEEDFRMDGMSMPGRSQRQPTAKTNNIMDKKTKIQDLIGNNDIAEALEMLKAELGNAAVAPLSSQWKQLRQDEMLGVLSFENTTTRRNQIVRALLTLTEQVGQPKDNGDAPLPDPAARKVFISYNHKDADWAHRIKATLELAGIVVTIDSERLQAGGDIKTFIEQSIRETDVTLSLVSTNSLLSAWVGMESLNTLTGERIAGKRFIACAIQTEFFERSFVRTATEHIDKILAEIKEEASHRFEHGLGIDDLQNERTRYLKLKNGLPEIVANLKERLTIDLSDGKFEEGMRRVVDSIK